jgi:hypothetical protein
MAERDPFNSSGSRVTFRALPGRIKVLKGAGMIRLAVLAALAMVGLGSTPVRSEPLLPREAQPYGADLLARVRVAAATIPGAQPSRINYIKFAESHRPLADIIDGGSKDNYVSARTAFQVVYPSGTVMIDSGMDQAVHNFLDSAARNPTGPSGMPPCRRR